MPITHAGDCELAHRKTFKWKRSWVIHNTQNGICVRISLHRYEKEGKRDVTLEKSLSVYKSFAYREWLSWREFLIISCCLTCVFPDWFCCLASYAAAIVAGGATGDGQARPQEQGGGKELSALHQAFHRSPPACVEQSGRLYSSQPACHGPQFLRSWSDLSRDYRCPSMWTSSWVT